MEAIRLIFKIDNKTWPTIDAEKERIKLAGLIDDALRDAGVGLWNGSSQKGTSLIFHCMVNDELVARHIILKVLKGHPLVRFLE